MYSLVSAPVLGFDLARLQGGSAVADVLLRGLALTPDDLVILAEAKSCDDWERLQLWQDVEVAAQQRRATRQVPDTAEMAALAELGELAAALTVLERAPLGSVDGLLHCVRHDVLDWTWRDGAGGREQDETAMRATAVICDAVAAAYLRDLLPPETRRRLAAGWLTAARSLPIRGVELGPQRAAVTGLLRRLRNATGKDLERLVQAGEDSRRSATDWAPAVHSASWAVHLAGRVRLAAAAQLLLVQAVDDARVPVADRAAGVWNLVSGAVQALVARDVLDGQTVHRLIDPYLSAMGPTQLG